MISVVTAVVFGFAPALQVAKSELAESLKEGGRTTSGAGHNRLRSLLVVSEIALALVLLIGAGLMIRSFIWLHEVRGSTPECACDGSSAGSSEIPRRAEGCQHLPAASKALASAGVESAAATTELPLGAPTQALLCDRRKAGATAE
jgi:hypothetical protein